MVVISEKTEKKARYSKKQALANEPKWSEFQNTIFDWVQNGSGNLRVGAVAGSGKSTVIVGIVNRLPSDAKVGIIAFNKHIVESMRSRVPTRITVTTAHAMGYATLNRYFRGEGLTVEENKYRKIARGLVNQLDLSSVATGKRDKDVRYKLTEFLSTLIRFCQSTLTEPVLDDLLQLINYYSLERPDGWKLVLPLVEIALDKGEKIALEDRVVDFGDQLWLLERLNIYPVAKEFLLVDEFQDASNAQLALYRKLARDGCRLIGVGDEKQSIMGFSGSTPEMWQAIEYEFNTIDLPLSVCYRCPTSHLDLARSIVPQIQARPDAPVGSIEVLSPSDVKERVELGDLVLCRFTAPLVSLCLKLITSGKQAKVRGRDIGSQLVSLANKAGSEVPYSRFMEGLREYCVPQIAAFRESDEDGAADSLEDRYMAVQACHMEFGRDCGSLKQFCDRITNLFTDDASPVILSTIHRAKGDESDRVFLLGCNMLPYTARSQQDWQVEQEICLTYVALTRAKQSLFLVPLIRKGKEDSIDELLRHPYGGLEVEPVLQGETKNTLIEGSKGSRSAVRGAASRLVRSEVKQEASKDVSSAILEPAPKDPEFCCLPFPIGSTVALKCYPLYRYTVIEVEPGVQTEIKAGENNPGHIAQPKEQGKVQHYYKLRTKSGGLAHWWHHQLVLIA